jgi:Ethanolamine utilization protein EutJ (predicted chaperonin)
LNRQTINDQTWAGIRTEFTLPTLDQVRRRLSELMEDPEPVMRQLVRVFIDDGTFCPGFQFLPGGQLHPQVVDLFGRALELQIPHNYFTLWMVTPSRALAGARPVDHLKKDPAPLLRALESYRWR